MGGDFLTRAGANAFGAFILHQPILVALHLLTRDWPLPVFAVFVIVSVAGIALSFGIAGLLRRNTLVRSVI